MGNHDSELRTVRFSDDGWRAASVAWAGKWWDYDPADDLYHARGNPESFGNRWQPRSLDWFSMRDPYYAGDLRKGEDPTLQLAKDVPAPRV